MSMSLALSICALFILLMQLINGQQSFNYYIFFLLFVVTPATTVFRTVVVLFTNIYTLL